MTDYYTRTLVPHSYVFISIVYTFSNSSYSTVLMYVQSTIHMYVRVVVQVTGDRWMVERVPRYADMTLLTHR
jgi:hypothetical protein